MSDNELLNIDPVKDAPVNASTAISALAMNFALKWFDISIIKDGVMYQQKKMEQVVFNTVSFSDVLEVAEKYEAWLINAPNRYISMLQQSLIGEVANKVLEGVVDILENEVVFDTEPGQEG